MSIAHYGQLQRKLELLGKLTAAAQVASGDRGRTLNQVVGDLRKKLREER